MPYTKLNTIVGWGVFAAALVIYLLSVSPSASFWDCGEFIACANELEVPHPPGAPFFLMFTRLFTMLGGQEHAAYMANLVSVFSGAFTVMLTFWITTIFGRRWLVSRDEEPEEGTSWLIMGAGVVAAGACAFASSFWFNIVEAEVYAMSSVFTALVVWLMLKWDNRANEPGSERYLLLIAYLMGLSMGVHLLNLLAIPALCLIYYYRKYDFSWKGFGAAIGVAVVILGVIQFGIGQLTFDVAWAFEQLFTGEVSFPDASLSGWGLPVGTGTMIWLLVLFGALGYGIYYTQKKQLFAANLVVLSVLMVYMGLSSYTMVYIRAQVDAPINENDPDNMKAFNSYMKREQYGDRPLLHGRMYSAQPVQSNEEEEKHYKFDSQVSYDEIGRYGRRLKANGISKAAINHRYVLYDRSPKRDYDEASKRFFPRMYSTDHYRGKGPYSYINYVQNKGSSNSPFDDQPTGGENMRFFFDYQINHMYMRYFAWNFIGRAGDEQGSGGETGFNSLLGTDDWEFLPEVEKNAPSRNHYFALPFLLGLLGAVFHAWPRRGKPKDFSIVMALFFFTGLAIVIYLNQYPAQPRERDYSFAGSFQTFAIWIGLGVIALHQLLAEAGRVSLRPTKPVALLLSGVMLLAVPVNMGFSNWDDHSRAGRYVAPDSAYNLLNSCKKNAILFTNGDNDTFPLWYLQEVEGVRTDVRIVNLSLVNTDWFIEGLKKPMNGAKPVPIKKSEYYFMGDRNAVRYLQQSEQTITLPVDSTYLVESGAVPAEDRDQIVSPMRWTLKTRGGGQRNYLMKQDLMIVEILRNVAKDGWRRPVYFSITIPPQSYLNLQPYFVQEGMAYRVLPVKHGTGRAARIQRADAPTMYQKLRHEFRYRNLGPESNVYLDANIKRMLGNFRNNFLTGATALIQDADRFERQANQPDSSRGALSPDSLRAKAQDYREKALELLDYESQTLSDHVAPKPALLLVQSGRTYAQLAQKGFEVEDKARSNLELARKRAAEQLRWQNHRRQQPMNAQQLRRNRDFNALSVAFRTYMNELKDFDAAEAVVEDIEDYVPLQGAGESFRRQLDQRRPQQQSEASGSDTPAPSGNNAQDRPETNADLRNP